MILPNRCEKDIAWVHSSPDLLDCVQISNELNKPVESGNKFLSDDSQTIDKSSIKPTSRLGYYFESLVFASLCAHPEFKIIAQNKQLISDNITIGEYDALIEDQDKRISHLEVAVKFYLQVGSGNNLHDWFGPDLKDRLDLKYQKLTQHQLQLTEQALKVDKQLDLVKPDKVALLCKGRLFYQYQNYVNKRFNYPDQVDKSHAYGFWISKQEFINQLQSDISLDWYVLPKSYWLADISESELQYLKPLDVSENRSPQLVAAMLNENEIMRGFVVPDDWLKKAQSLTSENFLKKKQI